MTPKTSGGYDCEYFIKDHLGNNRVTVWDSAGVAVVQQENHYYPFGMVMHGNSYQNENQENPNKYLYNGKEMQDELGLDWYDYSARMYDATLGRWHVIDPMAESYYSLSPYNYVANNPLKFIDPDGKTIGIYDEDGNYYTYDYQQRTFVDNNGDAYKKSDFIDNAIESLNYILDNNADVVGIIEELATNGDVLVYVKEGYEESSYLNGEIMIDFSDGNYTEVIDHNTGKTISNGQQSPALGFLHELGHSYDDLILGDMNKYVNKNADSKNYNNFTKTEKENIYWYEDLEEHRVINSYETPAAKILNKKGFNEGIRNNYKRTLTTFNSTCPSCTESKQQKRKREKQNRKKQKP